MRLLHVPFHIVSATCVCVCVFRVPVMMVAAAAAAVVIAHTHTNKLTHLNVHISCEKQSHLTPIQRLALMHIHSAHAQHDDDDDASQQATRHDQNKFSSPMQLTNTLLCSQHFGLDRQARAQCLLAHSRNYVSHANTYVDEEVFLQNLPSIKAPLRPYSTESHRKTETPVCVA